MADTHENRGQHPVGKGSSNRTFGLVFAAFFLIVALLPLVRRAPVRLWAAGISGVMLVLSLAFPSVLGPLNRMWVAFGQRMNRITNPIILFVIFVVVIIPVGIIMRVLSIDILRRKFDKAAESYWVKRETPETAPESFNRQF